MRICYIGEGITVVMNNCYDQYSEWFQTAIGVRQGCLLSSVLFNLSLEIMMWAVLDDHQGEKVCGVKDNRC